MKGAGVFRIRPWLIAIIAFFLIIQGVAFLKTGPFKRAHDSDSHLNYIRKVAAGDLLPRARACFECYHPPVYYWAAALYSKVVQTLGFKRPARALQIFSLSIFCGFLALGFLVLRQAFLSPRLLILGCALLFFWPSGFFHSLRIGNDVLFYFFHAASLWAIMSWVKNERNFYLGLALCAAILALFTKANGFVSLAMVMATTGGHLAQDPVRWRKLWPAVAWCTAICILAAWLFNQLMEFRGDVVSNVSGLSGDFRLVNSLGHIFGFDPQLYFDQPFYGARFDDTGRQYFSIVLLKSALYGEWWTNSLFAKGAAFLSELLLLPILGVCFAGLGRLRTQPDRIPILINAVFLVGALAVYRWRFPYGTSANFRYIYPVVISMAVLFADGVRLLEDREFPLLARTAQALLVCFIGAGVTAVLWF